MKKTLIFILFLMSASAAQSQTISVEPALRQGYCINDTMLVWYQATGNFEPDNFFTAQLSDGNGSFATFTNIGHSTGVAGSIAIPMQNTGNKFRVRVSSTDPYIISSNTDSDIVVVNYPSPNPEPSNNAYILMTGDSIQLADESSESSGSTFSWVLNQDAIPASSSNSSLKVMYPTPGLKTGTLTVTNSTGCGTTSSFSFNLLSCSPEIPVNVHIVTGTESGTDPFVWVKTGGNYTAANEFGNQTVFAEPGSSVTAGFRSGGVYYLRTGCSFNPQDGQGWAVAVINQGASSPGSGVQTFDCDSLVFDYSQLPDSLQPLKPLSSVEEEPITSFSIAMNHLLLSSENLDLSVKVLSVLGEEVLSASGTGELDLDLSPLPAGVYFTLVQSGDALDVRKIAVVH